MVGEIDRPEEESDWVSKPKTATYQFINKVFNRIHDLQGAEFFSNLIGFSAFLLAISILLLISTITIAVISTMEFSTSRWGIAVSLITGFRIYFLGIFAGILLGFIKLAEMTTGDKLVEPGSRWGSILVNLVKVMSGVAILYLYAQFLKDAYRPIEAIFMFLGFSGLLMLGIALAFSGIFDIFQER